MHAHHHADDHGHHHHAAPAGRVMSAMLMSAPARLAVAGGLVIALWALIFWAMT